MAKLKGKEEKKEVKSKSKTTFMTVLEVVKKINNTYFLPDIQREFKWDEDRVLDLFDSLMNEYPIGTFLIWKQHKDNYNKSLYNYYKFINTVRATDNSGEKLPKPVNIPNGQYLYSVLDGQQRLTAIYLALQGGFQVWKGRGRHPNSNPPLRELYFSPAGRDSKNKKSVNEFAFFNQNEVLEKTGWYKVKDLLIEKTYEDFCEKNKIVKKPEKTQIHRLFDVLTIKPVLFFFEIALNYSDDDAVNIFLRMNSGGLPLKKTELLFALAVNNWPEGRPQMEDFLKDLHTHSATYGSWDNIDKDFLLKACLYVRDEDISLSVKQLRSINFGAIKNEWSEICESITDVLKFLDDNGHCAATIKAANAILPLVYYRYHHKNSFDENVKKQLNALFIISQVNGLFKSSTDSVLIELRKAMPSNNVCFDLNSFVCKYESKNDLLCNENTISGWVFGNDETEPLKKGEDTRLLLSSLPAYKNKGNYYYEQDHLHPAKTFSNQKRRSELRSLGITDQEIKEWDKKKDTLGNLQLYRDRYNQNKNGKPLKEWKELNPKWDFAYDPKQKIEMDPKFIPGTSTYEIKYFDIFYQERSNLIKRELEDLLLFNTKKK